MGNIVRDFEEIELSEAELETIYGATGGDMDALKGFDKLFCGAGTHSINVLETV